MRENDFLAWIASQTPAHPRVPLGIGDDMAAVKVAGTLRVPSPAESEGASSTLALLKIDQCLDQVHFDLRHHTPAQAGRKAVNRCLSDCAAMACLPAALMISVALPREGPGSGEAAAKELFLACQGAAALFDCPLVGGDTAIWDQRLAITVAALGTLPQSNAGILPASPNHRNAGVSHTSAAQPANEIRRSGAQVGDTIFVSGQLGGSFNKVNHSGRHLTFTPRIHLAQKLAAAAGTGLHAMMDLSDGLAQDLPRLCAASHVGAQIHTAQLPIHPDAYALSEQDGIPAGLHALADGEDYELLFALDSNSTPNIMNLSDTPLTAIGTVTASGLSLIDAAGKSHPWPRVGWEHHC